MRCIGKLLEVAGLQWPKRTTFEATFAVRDRTNGSRKSLCQSSARSLSSFSAMATDGSPGIRTASRSPVSCVAAIMFSISVAFARPSSEDAARAPKPSRRSQPEPQGLTRNQFVGELRCIRARVKRSPRFIKAIAHIGLMPPTRTSTKPAGANARAEAASSIIHGAYQSAARPCSAGISMPRSASSRCLKYSAEAAV